MSGVATGIRHKAVALSGMISKKGYTMFLQYRSAFE